METQSQAVGMSQEEAEQMTQCQRCRADLQGGYSWKGKFVGEGEEKEMRILEVICFQCAEKERYAEYQKTKVITSKLLLDAYYLKDAELSISIEAIKAKVKEFEEKVWFGGLQKTVADEQYRGMKYESNGFTLMSYICAGRCMLTLEQGTASVTVITSDTGNTRCMGLQGVTATEWDATELLNRAIFLHGLGVRPIADENVCV